MESITIKSDGISLKGAIFSPTEDNKPHPVILFLHGWTSYKERSYQYARGLNKLGYICLLFDMRGHGESEGDINTATPKQFVDDALRVYDYLLTVKGVDPNRISLAGNSFGGYIACILSSKRKVERLALRVPADYPNDVFNKPKMQTSGKTTPEVFAWRTKVRKPPETFALEAISHFQGRVLIIEAEKDDVVHWQTLHNYKDAVQDKSKVTYLILKDGPHSIKEGSFRDQIEQMLVQWFR